MTRRPICVAARSESRGEQEPRAITIDGRRLEVLEVVARWREPGGFRFRVLASDGDHYELLCAEPDLEWWLVEAARDA